jgi:phosphoribosylamine--glycine ligase
MNILIIGSGGREHAIGLKCNESAHKPHLFFAPGNAGTADLGVNLTISDSNISELVKAVNTHDIDLTIIGPEAPLVNGLADELRANDHLVVGPNKSGAQIEGSKQWAKSFMEKHDIPTATYKTFNDYDKALLYVQNKRYPIVIKADGLAAGKGVTVAQTLEEAAGALRECFVDKKFADAGSNVVIEDFLQGEEASIFAFTDGKTILAMQAAQDHKALLDGDKGPNTGGMGAYSPTPIVTKEVIDKVNTQVFDRFLKGMQKEGIDYRGIIYAGLMIHNGDVNIVEFNARFGDPETQIILPQLENDIVDIFLAVARQELASVKLSWKNTNTAIIVLAAKGYPNSYPKGLDIELPKPSPKSMIIHAGTKRNLSGELVSSGGRILGVVGQDDTLQGALDNAYATLREIKCDPSTYRKDIGYRALLKGRAS